MKRKTGYLTAICFGIVIVMSFIRSIGWENLRLSIFDLILLGFGKKEILQMSQLMQYITSGSFTLFAYLLSAALVLAVMGIVFSFLMKNQKMRNYLTIIFCIAINVAVIFVVSFFMQKMGSIRFIWSRSDNLEGEFEISRKILYLWFGVFAVNIISAIWRIFHSDTRKKKSDTRVPYKESSMQVQMPKHYAVQSKGGYQVQPQVKEKISYPINSGREAFHGAIIGKCSPYLGKAYLLQELTPVYVQAAEDGTIYLSEERMPGALASIYYVDQYQEYCVTPERKLHTYLESGQLLGAGRDYYLARGKVIYFDSENNRFQLA